MAKKGGADVFQNSRKTVVEKLIIAESERGEVPDYILYVPLVCITEKGGKETKKIVALNLSFSCGQGQSGEGPDGSRGGAPRTGRAESYTSWPGLL